MSDPSYKEFQYPRSFQVSTGKIVCGVILIALIGFGLVIHKVVTLLP